MKYTKTSPNLISVLANANGVVAGSTFLARALAFELKEDGDKKTAPEWMQIFPAGPELATVDGRAFKISDPQALVDRVNAAHNGKPILVDYDHLSSFNPEDNGNSEASGWIEELEVRDGEIWARVVWTVRAAQKIADLEYRFVSPEFLVNKKTGEVASLSAVGLVNRPAFQMKALARSNSNKKLTGEKTMFKAIAKALGLPEDADETAILAAIGKNITDHKAELAAVQTPSMNKFVPRADYNVVLARAEAAEGDVKAATDATRKAEVETMIASAVKAGKIAPASKEHYVKLAMASEDGFNDIKALAATLPKITDASALDDADIGEGALCAEDKAMAASLGVSEEDYAKQLAADKS